MTRNRSFLALVTLALALAAGARADATVDTGTAPGSGVASASAAAAAPAPAVSAPAPAPAPAADASVQQAEAAVARPRKVSVGGAYGANIFAGMVVGALIGTAVEAIPYARDRHNQDPQDVIYGAVYGALGGAVGLGVPLSAWEIASDRPGAGVDVLYNALAFGVLGGAVGAGGGVISYSHKAQSDPDSAEDFTAAAAAGVCAGAGIGVLVGIVDASWHGPQAKIPGKGIHASAGLLKFSMLHDDGRHVTALPNATFFKAEF